LLLVTGTLSAHDCKGRQKTVYIEQITLLS